MGMFSHTPKSNKFEYTPRYYDERKERLEAMKKKYADPKRAEIEARIRGQFKRYERKNSLFMRTGFRFMLILLVLLAIVYALMKYFGIPLW